jgi:plastocyanin
MDPWTEFLGFVSQLVTPLWNELIQYIPLLLLAVLPAALALLAWMWQRNAARNRPRVAPALRSGAAPEGLHMPSPSPWPLVAPVGLFLVFAGIVFGDETGPNLLLLAAGLAIAGIAFAGWLMDATREYDATEAADHDLVIVAETDGLGPVERPVPDGIHLPPPSAWPFLAPIGLFFVFLGLALGPVLVVGGLVMAAIAAVGWTLDAGREYQEVAEGAHPDPAMRDPERAFPKRLMPVYVGVAGLTILLAMGPWMLSLLPRTEPLQAETGPQPTTTPYLSATSVLSFEQREIVVPADTPFTITFENKQAGVPHNVAIFRDPDKTDAVYIGELITGPATIEYPIEPMAAGEYPFICSVHPPMTGTLIVQ